MLKTVGRPKLRDVVAKRLQQYILDAGLKAGDRLPTETELATAFGVSRLSLREATKSLEFLGVVEAKPGRGLTVGSVNLDHVAECVGFHPALQNAPLLELIGARVVLETGALPYACTAMQKDSSIYQRLNDINSQLRNTDDRDQFIMLDKQFHRELVLASGLSPLVPFLEVLAIFFQRFRQSFEMGEWAQGIASHQAIIDAMRDGKVSVAADYLLEHIKSHEIHLERFRESGK